MTEARIFHLAIAEVWYAAERAGAPYAPDDYEADGFIHCSTADQLVATANRYYRGRRDLMLVELEAARLGDSLVWEPGRRDRSELFPHLYDTVDRDTVIGVQGFLPGPDGDFHALR